MLQLEELGKHFKPIKKIGHGAFGEVYLGASRSSPQEVAIKIESCSSPSPQLLYEAKLLDILNSLDPLKTDKPFPSVIYAAREKDFNIMVSNLLGPSLQSLLELCGGTFSMKTTLMLAHHILNSVEYLHNLEVVHRDFKPSNFLIGLRENPAKVYIVDFGLAKRFVGREGNHIPYNDNRQLTGTVRFASPFQHLGIEHSRRDDMIALGYMFVYFLRGKLPWMGLKAKEKTDKNKVIAQVKVTTKPEELCAKMPQVFSVYLRYCLSLGFDEKPDYAFCKRIFKETGANLDYHYDWDFDWLQLARNKRKEEEEKTNAEESIKEEDNSSITQRK